MRKTIAGAIALALLATGSPAFAAKEKGSSGRQAQAKGTREIPVCTKKLGAIAIVEPDNQWWREFNLGSPEAILKVFVQKSGCFTLVNRGRSMGSRAMERAMADNGELQAGSNLGKGQVKAADYFLEPDIVSAMTARTQLTEKTFARRFKAATGFAPLEYVQRLRIEESKQLLETCDSPIETIGEQVGYMDSASFRRLFKRYVGESPAEYRRRCAVPDHVRKLPT